MAGTVYISNYIEFGDGVHDDGPAIQRAIEQCITNGGGVLEFEAGKTYIVNT